MLKTTLRQWASTLALAALVLFAPTARGQHLADYTFSRDMGTRNNDNACQAPTTLVADDITASSATLSWAGDQSTYNVRYRELLRPDSLVNELYAFGDSNSIQGWTINDEDGNGMSWHWSSSRDGGYVEVFSFSNVASRDWLITPEILLGDTLSFWAKGFQYSTSGRFQVYVSTTGTNISDFTPISEVIYPDPTSYVRYEFDLSEYSGMGHVAIVHMADANSISMLSVDDITNTYIIPAVYGPWDESHTNVTSPMVLDGLTIETTYQWQVQGVNCDGDGATTEWSDPQMFTTGTFTVEANKWYAISSPKHDDDLTYQSLDNIDGLLPTADDFAYDLFRYDEATSTWENYKVRTDAMTFEQARGYIYRRSNDGTLNFSGNLNRGNISINLTASASGDLQGFNLVGNPYLHTYTLYEPCYSLTTDGSWEVHNSNYMLKIAEAVMVKVDEPGTLSFTELSSKGSRSAAPAMAFTVKGGGMQDVAYATLTEGNGMPKLGHLNEAAPVLSIPVEGRRYAIADLGDDCESFNMAFRGQEGEYTLTFNSELVRQAHHKSILNYCHLIDKVNGNEIDLLSNPTYTFTHSNTQTMSDRFMVKLTPNVEENTTGHFAYWNGSAWVVEGTGTLEVYDVLGRMVSRQTLNSQLSTLNTHQFPSTGVYVLRMGGKNQKIVVK